MIRGWVEDLLTLTDEDWGNYVFNRDPLVGIITPARQVEFRQKAVDCAVTLARGLRNEYGDNPIDFLTKQMGVKLVYKNVDSGAGYTMFASYKEPDTITIFVDNAKATDQVMAEHNLHELVGEFTTTDLLIAHELYHYLEQTIPNIFTAQKHLTLWKLGPIENRSRIICLEEIGAMAFSRELTGLKCSPYLLDVVMLYPHNPQRAKQLYEGLMNFSARRTEQV